MNLTINNLSKKYGKHIALDGISCQFTSGVYGILGANGSGKTTLMRMLATVTSPTAGTIQLNENSIFELGDDYRDLIGYLPQHIGLYKSFSAEKFLHYIAALKGLDKTYAALKIERTTGARQSYPCSKEEGRIFFRRCRTADWDCPSTIE